MNSSLKDLNFSQNCKFVFVDLSWDPHQIIPDYGNKKKGKTRSGPEILKIKLWNCIGQWINLNATKYIITKDGIKNLIEKIDQGQENL